MKKLFNVKFIMSSVALLCALHFAHYTVYAQPLSSSELINNAKHYDGKAVIYRGEVIGDVMRRGDFAWANVNDGKNAIGVWMSASFAKEIVFTGNHKFKGDYVEITGVFHRACSQHGGDLDIHALALRKTGQGSLIPEELNHGKINLAVGLSGFLGLLWILTLLKRK